MILYLKKQSKMRLNKISTKNILTLRYDITTEQPTRKLATVQDFKKSFNDEGGHNTEKLLNASFKEIKKFDKFSISLSGGIDSSLCLALLRKNFPKAKITAVSGVFEGAFDESTYAKKLAEKFDADFFPIQMESIYTKMPEIVYISKKPKWNTYNHLIAKQAQKFSKILVTGDGGDELFGGYIFRYKKFLDLVKPNDNWETKTIKYLECHNRDWVPDQKSLFGKNIKFSWNEIYNSFKPYFDNKLSPLNQVMLADFNGKLLHDFIPTGNAISSHYKIDRFSPFLNSEVQQFGLSLSIKSKYNHTTNQGKIILREINTRLKVKSMKEKYGFSPSLIFDWQKSGKDIFMAYAFEKDSNIYTKKIINRDWVIHALDLIENDGNVRYLNRITSILALEIWYRVFIKKDLNPKKSL
jgi:asparagine synthase (glutamine-hydrolysing)